MATIYFLRTIADPTPYMDYYYPTNEQAQTALNGIKDSDFDDFNAFLAPSAKIKKEDFFIDIEIVHPEIIMNDLCKQINIANLKIQCAADADEIARNRITHLNI